MPSWECEGHDYGFRLVQLPEERPSRMPEGSDVGAWALAEELTRHGDDPTAAFTAYEQRHRPHATAAQEFGRGGADLVVPATWEAIEARNTRLRAARPL